MPSISNLEVVDLKASDSAVLSHWPTPLLRLLVLLAPIVNATTRLVHLVTWTGGKSTVSHSFLVVLAWWAVCLWGYELLRYAPQLILLGVLTFTGFARLLQGQQMPTDDAARIATSDSINVTVKNLAVLADFFSSLFACVGTPLLDFLTWKDPAQTLGVVVALVTSWPLWLLFFSGALGEVWDTLGFSSIARQAYLNTLSAAPHVKTLVLPVAKSAQIKFPAAWQYATHLQQLMDEGLEYFRTYVLPFLCKASSFVEQHAPKALRQSAGPHVFIIPIISLRVRHLLLVTGTVVLTWCAPWAALIRHSLWRSAIVRRTCRVIWVCLSGQIFFRRDIGPRYIGPLQADPQSDDAFLQEKHPSADEKNTKSNVDRNMTRHEDVIYEFSIFENQRWWMGLDWTAALLPQERPSWADESHNPVSPPSSFSLPPAKTTLTPSPTNSKKYTKRLIRWQWVDPEWTVAGRDPVDIGSPIGTPTRGRRTSNASVALSEGAHPSLASSPTSATGDSVTLLDVDAEGWQYGDNGWEKMSKKAGLGRYTRRRRWIRRAVLVEIVQKDYLPQPEELSQGTATAIDSEEASIPSGASEADIPTASLQERLARVATNGGTSQDSVEGARNE